MDKEGLSGLKQMLNFKNTNSPPDLWLAYIEALTTRKPAQPCGTLSPAQLATCCLLSKQIGGETVHHDHCS